MNDSSNLDLTGLKGIELFLSPFTHAQPCSPSRISIYYSPFLELAQDWQHLSLYSGITQYRIMELSAQIGESSWQIWGSMTQGGAKFSGHLRTDMGSIPQS